MKRQTRWLGLLKELLQENAVSIMASNMMDEEPKNNYLHCNIVI